MNFNKIEKFSLLFIISLLMALPLSSYSQDNKHSIHVGGLYSSKLESFGVGASYYYRAWKFAEFGLCYETTIPKNKLRITEIGVFYHLPINLTNKLILYPFAGASYVVFKDNTPDTLNDEFGAGFGFGAGLRYRLGTHFELGLKYKFSTYTLDVFKKQSMPALSIGYSF